MHKAQTIERERERDRERGRETEREREICSNQSQLSHVSLGASNVLLHLKLALESIGLFASQ